MKKIITLLCVAVFGLVAVLGTAQAQEEGNKRKGKFAYRNVYKQCHELDPSAPATPPVNPDSKTMAQWQKVFETKDFEQFGCKAVWDKLTEEELRDIYTYLRSGAADSPTPAKCN